MHSRWKSLLYFGLMLLAASEGIISKEVDVEILSAENGRLQYILPAILDDESEYSLPYLLYQFDGDQGSVKIDSFRYFNPVILGDYDVFGFYGNFPYYSKIKISYEKTKSGFDAEMIESKTNKLLKFFPFKYDGKNLTCYKSIRIFYENRYSFETKSDPVYDYMIVCPSKYDTCFERLKEWKIMCGYKTKLYTIEHIVSVSSGRDNAEKLRNFIKSEYQSNNFKYLLLGGDRATIPVRRMFAMDCNAGYYADEDSIPADIYYSNLEGDFDYDKDGIFGEISDSADLTSELYAGRILYDTIYYSPSQIISRIISYEKTEEVSHLNRGMFMGMILWDSPFTPGGEAKDMIDNDIVPESYHILKFYEHLGHSGKADILDSLNIGYGIVNHNGHGSYKGIWVDSMTSISRGDATGLQNGCKTGLFYSIGCWIGAFDRDNTTYLLHSITENLQSSPTGGFISIITNSRYGWGAPGYPGYGVSDMFDYRFFSYLFSDSCKEGAYLLNRLKEYYLPFAYEENLYRWHLYQLNYFGDPSTSIYTRFPDTLFMSKKIFEDRIDLYIKDKNGIPKRNLFVTISKDSIFARGRTDYSGFFSFDKSAISDSTVNLTVRGENVVTIVDSIELFSSAISKVQITFDTIYSGCSNYIHILNSDLSDCEIYLKSRFIDTLLTLTSQNIADIYYSPLVSSFISDTLFVSVDGFNLDTFYVGIKPAVMSIDSLWFNGTVFHCKVSKNISKTITDCSVSISLNGAYEIFDTIAVLDFSDSFSVYSATGIPAGLDYLHCEAELYKNDTLLSSDGDYINNGEYIFDEDFSGGFEKWSLVTDGWNITSEDNLHCGQDYMYLNGMDDTIASKSFKLLPSSTCSVYIYAKLPILEFVGFEPIFDLDGLFINLIKESDTTILDFISSGGALEKGMLIKGYKEYALETDTPVNAKMMMRFISDSVITDSGAFIKSVKIKPRFFYDEFMQVTRDDINLINKDKLQYFLTGFEGPVKMKIHSLDGRLIKGYNFSDSSSITVQLKGVPNGVYFIMIESDRKIYKDKIILIR